MRIVVGLVFLVALTGSTTFALTGDATVPAAMRLVDLNADGQPDKLLLGVDGSVSVAVNRGNGVFESVWQDLPAIDVVDLLVTDLNGDSFTDVYLLAFGENVALLGDGTGRLVDATASLGLGNAGLGVSAERFDLDLDGLDEVLLHNLDSDVIFWAQADGRFESDTETLMPSTASTDLLPQLFMNWLMEAATDPSVLGGDVVLSVSQDDAGKPVLSMHIPPPSQAGSGGGTQAATLGRSQTGHGSVGPSGTISAGGPDLGTSLNALFVNDNANEVDSADIVDGSLTGADISTSGGAIVFGPGAVTVTGPISSGVASVLRLDTTLGVKYSDGSVQTTATLVGPAGPAGATGPAGPTGPTGAAGADGADGATGPQGPAGPTGATGAAGADGADGAAGPMGSTGPAGADGADGATGPQGPAGSTGATGAAGADGADGS
ncbi:MAG: FG-GAP repeat domain-containing protein, partial [Planctomycetota bacterium]